MTGRDSSAQARAVAGGETPAADPAVAWTRLDLVALATIGLVTLLAALPALRGDLILYMDNPVHLAEIRELSRPDATGWSTLGYLGFPLHMLQSPLIYWSMAALTRWGLNLEVLYTAVTVLALAAPAFAFYYVARKRLAVGPALALSCTIILYRASLVGGAAALAGMFGFHLAGAALILVFDRLVQQRRTLRDVWVLALLAGFIGLTHMYITIALVHLGLVHFAWSLWRGRETRRRLPYDVAGLGLGVLAAAAYWMPNLLSKTPPRSTYDPFLRTMSRMVTTGFPLPPPEARGLARLTFDPILQIDVLPHLVVMALAALGIRHALRDRADGARYGAIVAVLFVFFIIIQPVTGLALLGPQNPRLIWVVRLGVLLAAIPAIAAWSGPLWRGPRGLWLTAGGALVMSVLCARVVAYESIPLRHPERADVDRLWSWLREHRQPGWGRVYIQDLYGDSAAKLGQSHILASTAGATGLEQLGPFYGSTPYVKSWAFCDFGFLFDRAPDHPALVDDVVTRMGTSSSTHLVVSNPAYFARLEADPRLAVRARLGRFLVLELRAPGPLWARISAGSGTVSAARLSPGRLRLSLEGAPREVSISEAFHPFWRVDPPAGPLRADEHDLMVLGPLADGTREVALTYRPPALPGLITRAGVLGIVLLLALDLIRRRRARARA